MSEKSLVKQFNSGNNLAFRKIFDMYYLPLRSFACHYVDEEEITDDFVQDAFVTIWERRSNFTLLATIKSYLYTSVKNACLDHLRHLRVKEKKTGHLIALFSEENEQKFILEEEVHTKIYEAIRELPEQSRRIILMSMEGLSNPEIAEQLSISLNTVKTSKLRAYKFLRSQLTGIQWVLFILWMVRHF